MNLTITKEEANVLQATLETQACRLHKRADTLREQAGTLDRLCRLASLGDQPTLTAEPAKPIWRPTQTASRDGTWILLATNREAYPFMPAKWLNDSWLTAQGGRWSDADVADCLWGELPTNPFAGLKGAKS